MNRVYWLMLIPMMFLFVQCSNKNLGERVKEPFSSGKYESNNRWFRAVGKGESSRDNIAAGKADIEAKRILAQQVQTTVKVVTDQYLADTQTENGSEVNDMFQSLAREVTNTEIGDLRKIGEEKYLQADGTYAVYIAYEIKKSAMYRFLKKRAKLNAKLDNQTRKIIEDILDKELEKLAAAGDD